MTPNGGPLNAFYERLPGIVISPNSRFGAAIVTANPDGSWEVPYPKNAASVQQVRRVFFDERKLPPIPGNKFSGVDQKKLIANSADVLTESGAKAFTGDNFFEITFRTSSGSCFISRVTVRQKNPVYA
jgi:hypothetical protein